MKWKIISNDIKAEGLIEKFCDDANAEWEKQQENNKMLKNFPLAISFNHYREKENEYFIAMPVAIPKVLAMLLGGYKKKTVKKLQEMFKSENVSYEKISYEGN